MSEEELLSQLNPAQRAAVEYIDGPSLVIAGAGSGKTRVLTYKIAYLLQKGLQPWSILALTFTNKAANEMKERIGRLVDPTLARQLHMGTFHSIFARILRVEALHIGFKQNFTIYDEADSRSLLKAIIKELGLDDKKYKPATVHSRISMAKNRLCLPDNYLNDSDQRMQDQRQQIPEVGKIYGLYCERCRQANAMDFDDLLVYTYLLFKDHEDIRQKYSRHFKFVLVDEYQDTNWVQQCITLQLTKEQQRLCVVGDDSQSIYSFRGANIDNILGFQKQYPGTKLFKLEQNYRSTQRIVAAANSLISHNQRQIPKEVFSENAEGDKIHLCPAYSDREEAAIVCKEIRQLHRQEDCHWSDFAILYRTNAQSRSFEEELRRQEIPYRIFGGLSFYQRKEIKDIIAYFRLVANTDDEEAFKRIINYPARGIGNTTVARIAAAAAAGGVSFWAVITEPARYQLNVNRGTMAKLAAFRDLISSFQQRLAVDDAYTLGKDIIETSGISKDIYSGKDADALSRQENLEEFMNSLQSFVADQEETEGEGHALLTDFLQQVSLLTDLDSDDGTDADRMTLMTIHAAKGLEFPTVFVVGLEENIFPSLMSLDSPRQLEEERRLLYVAITRAERHCYLTYARNRWRYGTMQIDEPSRFLRDIDHRYIDDSTVGSGPCGRPESTVGRGPSGRPESTVGCGPCGRPESTVGCGPCGRPNGTSRRRMPWDDDDYEPNKPYVSNPEYQRGVPRYSNRMQNSRPVASQFMADPKPKITHPRRPEAAVDPFSEGFKRKLVEHGGSLRRLNDAMTNGGRAVSPAASSASHVSAALLQPGTKVEHQRFGIGTVVQVVGSGENEKATIDFENSGRKQLLLKFARLSVIG
ncbi:MAG: 3'-5' exonuclease [Prevotellaceae bacterium]|nr:3'-5' exonuclease [Prevotellaceae bacterium]